MLCNTRYEDNFVIGVVCDNMISRSYTVIQTDNCVPKSILVNTQLCVNALDRHENINLLVFLLLLWNFFLLPCLFSLLQKFILVQAKADSSIASPRHACLTLQLLSCLTFEILLFFIPSLGWISLVSLWKPNINTLVADANLVRGKYWQKLQTFWNYDR